MKASNCSSRTLVLIALMAALLLPAARCGQSQTNSPGIQGSSLQGIGPSSDVTFKSGAGQPWSYGNPPNPQESFMLNKINDYRVGRGLRRLEWHDGMHAVAFAHTKDMNARNFFSIVNIDGVDVFQQLVSSSPRIDFDNAWAFVGQYDQAAGPKSNADKQVTAMLENSVTRALIESPRVTHFASMGTLVSSKFTFIFAQNVRPQY